MATFAETQSLRNQQHFEVLEIDLPVITGVCTIGAFGGAGTPLTCDQQWEGEYKTYYFTNENADILPSINGEPIYRLIKSIKETSTQLKPGEGLSSRSSLSVTLGAGKGLDPNNSASGVTDEVKKQGSLLGKMAARQIIENKNARLKLYRVEANGGVDLIHGAQTRRFLTDTLSLNANGTWSLSCKDLLSLVNLGEKSWPVSQGGFLRQDANESTLNFLVDEFTDWSAVEVVRIGEEHVRVDSVTGNLTNAAQLNVLSRGSNIVGVVSGKTLTETIAEEHDAGDEVFICDVSDNETIDSLLSRVLIESDFPSSLIPATEWANEVLEWHASDKINTLHSESESVNDVINRILTGYLMDLWFSVTENKARLSAISVHKKTSDVLVEGREINAYSIKKVAKESLRATRALILYDKRNLSESSDAASFKKGSQFSDNTLISPALFVKHKDKQFENNFLLDKNSADLLTQRYVSRFKFTPFERSWITDERYLTFKTGDVVDLATTVDQGIFGIPSGNIRAQITKINPVYKGGRTYQVKALTYEAAFNSGSEIVLDSPLGSVNLYILAGAPSQPIDLTFVFDSSYSFGDTAINTGAFAAGSTITIIMIGGFDGQASGGHGGQGESIAYLFESNSWESSASSGRGTNGGVVFTGTNNVDIDIYFSGATPSAAYPLADGYIRAPGAGGAGTDSGQVGGSADTGWAGNAGGGGAGRPSGLGGNVAQAFSESPLKTGVIGGSASNGDIIGFGGIAHNVPQSPSADNGGNWGEDTTFALAGAGIIDNGANITLHADGDLATRYINGNGSHP